VVFQTVDLNGEKPVKLLQSMTKIEIAFEETGNPAGAV